jgi:HK97 family phage major capsid protein
VTTASTTAITIEEILDLVHSIDPAYRNNAGGNVGFMFHDQTLKALKKLKDGENRPLWKPSVREGEPDTFDGYRYWLNQDMADTLAAAAKPILFGDFSKYYIRLVNAVEIRRADELFLANDLVGFFGFHRWDANLMDTAAIKHLAMAAS